MPASILIVDDSLTVRMDLADAFERAGFKTIPCATAAEARDALEQTGVALIVLDVLLPDGDGIDLMQEFRQLPEVEGVPILLLSSETEVRDRVRGMVTGADEYIGKPYNTAYVIARARELLRTKRSRSVDHEDLRILVIDDSLTFREELADILRNRGYDVHTAESGEEGLRLAADLRPDAIVVDGQLPGMDGSAVIRRIRLDAALRTTPCLFLTASEDANGELRALEAGADTFLQKGDDEAVLLARLSAAVRRVEEHPGSAGAASLLGPKKLLAVDDSPTFLNELAASLRAEGYDIVLAHSGEEALELLAVEPVDCILLDLLMPGIGGHETCRRIKGVRSFRDIPIIMLTALEDRDAMLEGLGAGADDFIAKSSDFQVLKARLLAQLRRKQFEDEHRKIRDQLLRIELEASEARAAQEMAEARAALVEELEHRVAERTQELRKSQEQLVQAQKMEAVGRLAGGIAHDFNNMLSIIMGYSALLLQGDRMDPEYWKKNVGLIQHAGERAATLTRQLLAFSRKQVLQPRVLDLNEVLRGTTQLLQRLIGEDIDLVVNLRSGLGLTEADPGQVEQILMNLAINARDAMPRGGKLTIETSNVTLDQAYVHDHAEAQSGPHVMLAVTDTGHGMDAATRAKIFEPFFTTKDLGKGTGLGLSTVYGIVKQSGGSIWVYSEPGRGTTFKVYLPQVEKEKDVARTVRSLPVRARGQETILVVEDEPAVAQLLCDVLEDAGYRVLAAADTDEAMRHYESERDKIQMLLTDVVVPTVGGAALAKKLLELNSELRVAYMSGYTDDAISHQGILNPGVVLLEKPILPADLLNKVHEVLG